MLKSCKQTYKQVNNDHINKQIPVRITALPSSLLILQPKLDRFLSGRATNRLEVVTILSIYNKADGALARDRCWEKKLGWMKI